MAALLHPGMDICDLRRLAAHDLAALLEEEIRFWREQLDWDFGPSADLVRRFTDVRALNGFALVNGSGVVGYSYSVIEENKGIIGDFFIRKEYRTPENQYRLLERMIEQLMQAPHVRRVESQLTLFQSRPAEMPFAPYLRTFDREFLSLDLAGLDALPPAAHPGISIEPWEPHYQDAAAHLIASAYAGHVDALINDQYRSVAGARRFLFNIVQFPGCGTFLQQASLAAFEKDTRWMAGMCLTSTVAPETGHVTQICLSRDARNKKLGYEMMRQSLLLMRVRGLLRASLTVTSQNDGALALYRGMGFRHIRRFPAFVWEGY
jgi:ribosomal protein S18 acetylase RimI-like enzyme